MLELAIAEAYRPRVPKKAQPLQPAPSRPPSFATNPNAKASTFSLRSRPSSSLSRNSSAYSRPSSFKTFIARRKRPDSVLSSRTEEPEHASRSDSVLSPTTEVPEPLVSREDTSTFRDLPKLPPSAPLPPQEELEEFDTALQAAIDDLQASPSLVTHELATITLQHLAHVADMAACIATSWPEFWSMIVHAAKLLCSARKHMNGVENVLVRSLERVAKQWNEEQGRGRGSPSTAELARITGEAVDSVMRERETNDDKISVELAQWLRKHCENLHAQSAFKAKSNLGSVCLTTTAEPNKTNGKEYTTLRILTCTYSATILDALTSALSHLPSLRINLSILSSPSDLPSLKLPSSLSPSLKDRLHIIQSPVQAIGTASQKVDIFLLNADCIDTQGNIRGGIGALGAAVCVKNLSPLARVVVLGRTDAISSSMRDNVGKEDEVKSGIKSSFEVEPGERKIDVVEVSSEWVPAQFVHAYLTELGSLRLGELEKLADETAKLKKYIFGEND